MKIAALLLAGPLMLSAANNAYAACTETSTGSGIWQCVGTITTTPILTSASGGVLKVSTTGTTSIITTSGAGLNLTGDTGITFADTNAATVTGATIGINAEHNGSGVLSITTTGAVTGTLNEGIIADGGINVTDLTIEAATVTGREDGIQAAHLGSGNLSIITSGDVTARIVGFGISAESASTTMDLTIAAVKITGANRGIYAQHKGGGVLSITTTGDVTGVGVSLENTGVGIFAEGEGNVMGLTIKAIKVMGKYQGINARHSGSGGALSITTTGDVIGMEADGIIALSEANVTTGLNNVTGLTIAAAKVSGGTIGINAAHSGSGVLSVTASGDVTGTLNEGIIAEGGTDVTGLTIVAAKVTGGTDGIKATHLGSGVLSVTTSGDVSGGTGSGIATVGKSGSTTSITLTGGTVSATSGKAITDTVSNATLTVNKDAAVTGAIDLGAGNDTLVVVGGDISAVTGFDGGADTDTVRFAGTNSIDATTITKITNFERLDVAAGMLSLTSNTLAFNDGPSARVCLS